MVVMVLVVVVETPGVDAVLVVGWVACRPVTFDGQVAVVVAGAAVVVVVDAVSSVKELILRCEPLQLLPQEIFTEQLILS